VLGALSDRVTITDDLEVPSVKQYPNAPVAAILAGDDILMFAQHETGSEQAFRAISSAVAANAIPRSLAVADAEKVIRLKRTVAR
jgi:hypothetical protein